MILKDRLRKLWSSLASRDYREAFVDEHISSGIAVQILENRKARNLTQKGLGVLAGMGQVRISKLENPSDAMPNLKTIRRIASAFDCGLRVEFVPFSELALWSIHVPEKSACVPAYAEDSPRADD